MSERLVLPTDQPDITLRQYIPEDAPAIFKAINAENGAHLSQFGDPTATNYDTLDKVEDSIVNPKYPDKLRMGIWDKDTLVGSINLTPERDGSAEVGYWVGAEHLRKGYALLATTAISGFASSLYSRVFAEVVEGNDASAGVLKKAGYRQTGRDKKHLIFDFIDPAKEHEADVVVTSPTEEDIVGIMPLLRNWIRSRDTGLALEDEIQEFAEAIRGSIHDRNDRRYMIAKDVNGKVKGIMGLKKPDEKMLPYATSDKVIEIINAYVDPNTIGQGVGGKLLACLEEMATEQGYDEIILNSGPRNKHSGWDFWNRKFGESVDTAVGFYGNGADAKVWRKSLTKA